MANVKKEIMTEDANKRRAAAAAGDKDGVRSEPITSRDYNKLGRGSNKEFWNAYAPNFRKKPQPNGYEYKFLEIAQIEPGKTIFDMGCGAGTLALPLALRGHHVYACDFSEKMLEMLEKESQRLGLTDRIHSRLLDWGEDWSNLDLPVCDIAIASRSMMLKDLDEALDKLESRAKERVINVNFTGLTPHYNVTVARAIGHDGVAEPAYIKVIEKLFERGALPEIRMINSERTEYFDSFEDCITTMSENFFKGTLTADQLAKLEAYSREHLVKEIVDGEEKLKYNTVWPIKWAFISWYKNDTLKYTIQR